MSDAIQKSPARELYDRLTDQICAMDDERHRDLEKIREHERDWQIRSHLIDVRNARFTVETSDLVRQRMALARDMATYDSNMPVAGLVLNQN